MRKGVSVAEAFERWMYGDPLEAAMRIESKSCKGCEFEVLEKWFSERVMRCLKDKKHGMKCKQYRAALQAAKP